VASPRNESDAIRNKTTFKEKTSPVFRARENVIFIIEAGKQIRRE